MPASSTSDDPASRVPSGGTHKVHIVCGEIVCFCYPEAAGFGALLLRGSRSTPPMSGRPLTRRSFLEGDPDGPRNHGRR